jgi:hypothetical protein
VVPALAGRTLSHTQLNDTEQFVEEAEILPPWSKAAF